jgi:hypothetical protein
MQQYLHYEKCVAVQKTPSVEHNMVELFSSVGLCLFFSCANEVEA